MANFINKIKIGEVTYNIGMENALHFDGLALIGTWFVDAACKTATKEVKSVSIKKDWLEKLNEERFAMGKQHSALAFDFGDGKDYYIIDNHLMDMLMDYMEEIYGKE